MIRFARVDQPDAVAVTIQFDGIAIRAAAGETIAGALMRRGISAIRQHPVTNEPRLPYCLMGVCFECLVEVDGIKDCRACQITVREGMVVRSGLIDDA